MNSVRQTSHVAAAPGRSSPRTVAPKLRTRLNFPDGQTKRGFVGGTDGRSALISSSTLLLPRRPLTGPFRGQVWLLGGRPCELGHRGRTAGRVCEDLRLRPVRELDPSCPRRRQHGLLSLRQPARHVVLRVEIGYPGQGGRGGQSRPSRLGTAGLTSSPPSASRRKKYSQTTSSAMSAAERQSSCFAREAVD